MRLPFAPEIGPFFANLELDVDVYRERGGDKLVINDVLDGKFSLLHDTDKEERLGKWLTEGAYLIADMAERDPKLLALAVEQRLEDAA